MKQTALFQKRPFKRISPVFGKVLFLFWGAWFLGAPAHAQVSVGAVNAAQELRAAKQKLAKEIEKLNTSIQIKNTNDGVFNTVHASTDDLYLSFEFPHIKSYAELQFKNPENSAENSGPTAEVFLRSIQSARLWLAHFQILPEPNKSQLFKHFYFWGLQKSQIFKALKAQSIPLNPEEVEGVNSIFDLGPVTLQQGFVTKDFLNRHSLTPHLSEAINSEVYIQLLNAYTEQLAPPLWVLEGVGALASLDLMGTNALFRYAFEVSDETTRSIGTPLAIVQNPWDQAYERNASAYWAKAKEIAARQAKTVDPVPVHSFTVLTREGGQTSEDHLWSVLITGYLLETTAQTTSGGSKSLLRQFLERSQEVPWSQAWIEIFGDSTAADFDQAGNAMIEACKNFDQQFNVWLKKNTWSRQAISAPLIRVPELFEKSKRKKR